MTQVNFRDLRTGNLVQCTSTSVNHIEAGDLFEVSYRTASTVVLNDIVDIDQRSVDVVVGYEDTLGRFKLLDDSVAGSDAFVRDFGGFIAQSA